jgi:hypothetical protein
MQLRYRICGLTILSNVPLPELSSASDGEPAYTFELVSGDETRSAPYQVFHRWLLPNGDTWLCLARDRGGYLFHFPELADFRVDAAGGVIRCHPAAGTPPETIRHLFLDQVIPLVLSRRGKLVLHASAVVMPEGASAFIGMAGMGKSTLAASLADQGFPLLTDDCLVLEENGKQFSAIPSYCGVRLWDEASSVLFAEKPVSCPVAHYTPKKRLNSDNGRFAFCSHPVRLTRMYFLSRPGTADTAPATIAPLSPREAFLALVRYAYKLDLADREMLRQEFVRLGRLVALPICRQLVFRKDFSLLPAIREAVLDDLSNDQPLHQRTVRPDPYSQAGNGMHESPLGCHSRS